MNLNYIRSNVLSVSFVLMGLLFNIVFMPIYEWPDEYYHLKLLLDGGGSIYQKILLFIPNIFDKSIVYYFVWSTNSANDYFSFFSDSYRNIISSGVWQYNSIKLINILILASVLFFMSIDSRMHKFVVGLDRVTYFRLSLFVFIMPSVQYSLASISPEFFFIVSSILVPFMLVQKRYMLVFFLVTVAFIEDRSAITLLFFCLTYFSIKRFPRFLSANLFVSIFSVSVFVVISVTISLLVMKLALSGIPLFKFIIQNVEYNSKFGSSPINKIGAVISSMYFLAGNMSFRASFLEYAAFIALVVFGFISLSRVPNNLDVRAIYISSIATMVFFIYLMPPLSQARYYLFSMMPIIFSMLTVKPLSKLFSNDKYYFLLMLASVIVSLFHCLKILLIVF